MRISVITAVLNKEATIKDTIDSVLNSGFENSPANKNIDQLKTFIDAIKSTSIHSAR